MPKLNDATLCTRMRENIESIEHCAKMASVRSGHTNFNRSEPERERAADRRRVPAESLVLRADARQRALGRTHGVEFAETNKVLRIAL